MKTIPLTDALKTLSLPGLGRNLFSSPPWLSVLMKTYQTRFFVKYIQESDIIRSYIIYSVVNNFLEEKICIASYCDYFDCYVTQKEDWQEFFTSLRCDYPKYRIAIRNLRDNFLKENPNFELLSKEKHHILDIRDNLDVIWKKTNNSFRSAVKQAQKNNLKIRRGGKKELKIFYNIYLKLRKQKYRIFPQPFRFFENIWDEFIEKDQGFLMCAFSEQDQMIAATLYLICGDTLFYKSNTSDIHFLRLRPNNLMFWEGIKIAKERGLKFIDMGSSGLDQKGLILFKEHTGASSQEICHYGFSPEGYKFSQKRILKVYTQLCTMPWMPDCVACYGSNLIYPYLA